MTQTNYDDNVVITGSRDIDQLKVKGNGTQTNPLQSWENSAGVVQAQVKADGRFQVSDTNLAPDINRDSLIEAHRSQTSTARPKRGLHSLGQVADTLDSIVQWIVQELELFGSNGVKALHMALRVKLTNSNIGIAPGNNAGSDLRAGDFEVINNGGSVGSPIDTVTGIQTAITNNSGAVVNTAYGLRVKLNNPGTITNPYALYTDQGIVHFGDSVEVQIPLTSPGTPPTDIVRLYPKADGKLYAKNWVGTEYDLTSGSGGGSVSKQFEIDFGALGTRSKVFTITDTDVNVLSKLFVQQSGNAATGRSQDENEMDALTFRSIAGAGQFTLYADSLFGPVAGKYKISYSIT
jgi:hypothetical protein